VWHLARQLTFTSFDLHVGELIGVGKLMCRVLINAHNITKVRSVGFIVFICVAAEDRHFVLRL